jgi:peptidoglycan/xylan/chitin deacetylase (PgdA/CDA1 family)
MRFKRWARAGAARASRLFRQRGAARRAVLCWHSVDPQASYATVRPEAFAAQLDRLAAECELTTFSGILAPRAPGARPAVAITFDDGYEDNLEHAAPLLACRNLRATFFLTAGLIARDPSVLARFRADRGCEVAALTWQQARDLHHAGMEIGAHTWSHPNLAALSRTAALEELTRSRRVLEDELGAPVTTMAYPYGKPGRHVSEETIALASEAGYEAAAAVLFRGLRDDERRLCVPRFFVNGEDTPETLVAKARGDWDAIGWCQERLPRWAARALSPADFKTEAIRA